MAITDMRVGGGDFPRYIVGPVIKDAATVEIHFANGERLSLPTFPAPPPLDNINFYAIPLSGQQMSADIVSAAGRDAAGNIVACLAPATANDGRSALTDCS